MASMSAAELTCLSVGISPSEFPAEEIRKVKGPTGPAWPAREYLARRYEQIRRKFDPQARGWSVNPEEFLRWARQTGLEVHSGFLDSLALVYDPKPKKSPPTSARTDRRELNSVAQILVALAIKHEGYRPGADKSRVPAGSVSIVADLGIEISIDTVRKYLDLGSGFISPDWKPGQ
jgi:hypothetical protein